MDLKNESFRKVVENLHDGLYFVDTNRVITYWNRAAEEITGFTAEEVVGRSCAENILTHMDSEGNNLCLNLCPLAAAMEDGQPRGAEVYLHHKDGHRVPVSVRVSTVVDDAGDIIGGVELFSDISSQEANALRLKELEKLALIDQLTQLANRVYLEREINGCLEENRRYGIPFGILFMDIDHFKRFNDSWGHDVGDEVLKFVSRTFVANARPFDLYGRWGGEEFVGIIRNIGSEDLAALGNRLRGLIAGSYLLHEGKHLQVTISMGATTVADGDSIDRLMRRADTLLYRSKEEGRNRLSLG
jgi:diguanylate cyclase (GGDEF)-like protein/PAS domain S-box-containing protein